MVILIYFAIILASVTERGSTKFFQRYASDSSVFNAIKALSSLILFATMAMVGFSFHLPTLLFGLVYGIGLCISMYAGYQALRLGPMALTSMLVSFSVLIPFLWGVLFEHESLNLLRIFGVILLLGAMFLINWDKLVHRPVHERNEPTVVKRRGGTWLLFVGTTFLCNGICSILQKRHQALYPEAYTDEFMFFAMLLCALIFSVTSLRKNTLSGIWKIKGKWLGALSGVTNGLANFLTLSLAGFENASVLFPVISAGNLLGVLLCGRILFHEKLRGNHYAALICGMLSVILLKL